MLNELPRNLCFTWASVSKITKKGIMENPLNGGGLFNQFFSLRCIVRSSRNRNFWGLKILRLFLFVLSFVSSNITRWWFQIFFIFIPTWGNDPIWLIFFQMGWNHQLDNIDRFFFRKKKTNMWNLFTPHERYCWWFRNPAITTWDVYNL